MTRRLLETLKDVHEIAQTNTVTRRMLLGALRDARAEGASLRELAQASGMSHETVRSIVRGETR